MSSRRGLAACGSLVLALGLAAAWSCGGQGSGPGEADAEPDGAAADGDGDLEADIEAAAADGDGVEADAEAEADGGLDAEAERDGEAEPDADREVEADAEAAPPPAGCVEGRFAPFFGNLHAHTSDSDGSGSPATAFAHARDAAGLDFMAVTDHLEQLYNLWGTPSGEYEDCRAAADLAYVPGSYVSICGFEYGSGFSLGGSTGHNNVFWSDRLFPMIQLDFRDFFRTLAACAECVGQMNHPRDERDQDWDDFEYVAAADERVSLFEMNGAGETWAALFEALDAGWHLAPVRNQDNHSADWGTRNDTRTGFWLSELTREALRQAMVERRSFATHDRNATVRLMAAGTCWMGSVLSGLSSVDLSVEVFEPDAGEGFATLELFGPAMTLLASTDCAGAATCRLDHVLAVSAPTYALARATELDGDLLHSAPVWAAP